MNVHSTAKIAVVDMNVHQMGNVSLYMVCHGAEARDLPCKSRAIG